MNDAILLEKISKLPKDLKTEVADFVDFLLDKSNKGNAERKPVFGCAKGVFTMMPDFDEPLEGFKFS
jgi:hypothetical protein